MIKHIFKENYLINLPLMNEVAPKVRSSYPIIHCSRSRDSLIAASLSGKTGNDGGQVCICTLFKPQHSYNYLQAMKYYILK